MRSTFLIALILAAATVRAQQLDAFLGAGSAYGGSTGRSINTFGDGTLYPTPSLGGVFTDFGLTPMPARNSGQKRFVRSLSGR